MRAFPPASSTSCMASAPKPGVPLVEHPNVDVVSFTGSTAVGRWIGEVCGRMMRKVSLELGGKNPLVVCDDADLDNAVRWTCLSAFSNAGQRCASGSRIIIFEPVYDAFKEKLLEAVAKLKVGPTDNDDFGPVINQRQLDDDDRRRGDRQGERCDCACRWPTPDGRRACRWLVHGADRGRGRGTQGRIVGQGTVRPGGLALLRARLRGGAGDGQ